MINIFESFSLKIINRFGDDADKFGKNAFKILKILVFFQLVKFLFASSNYSYSQNSSCYQDLRNMIRTNGTLYHITTNLWLLSTTCVTTLRAGQEKVLRPWPWISFQVVLLYHVEGSLRLKDVENIMRWLSLLSTFQFELPQNVEHNISRCYMWEKILNC